MGDFVTVLTRPYPQELYVIKSRLESDGIECFLKDELTVQSNNFWSNAVGGVKLQVQEQDVKQAIELLKELGYIKEEQIYSEDLLTRIDNKTSSLPFLKALKVSHRVVVLLVISVTIITTLSYLILKPSRLELLTDSPWTIDKVYFNNKLVGPKTDEILNVPGRGDVDLSELGELASFDKNNSLSFPGLHSRVIDGTWKFNGSQIILHADTLNSILDGSYDVDISDKQLVLKSLTTVIIAHN